jgi:plasmid stabilization system protein ParE
MDLKVVWSPEAAEDLESVSEYIARDSLSYASAVTTDILAKCRHLQEFPRIGRVVPELNDENIRECMAYSYRIVYRLEEGCITIAAIIHGKQHFAGFEDRFE